ncbi:hypothetical protein [Noviherbaspirillum malthae]|uniref:hypothetical protein n=1 Tax=Noviherbaspirillum malthae TaxID=1260987 RepID=UPI00188F0AFC|nr:hypothetical protein [Noviherbaspirillum malthae]
MKDPLKIGGHDHPYAPFSRQGEFTKCLQKNKEADEQMRQRLINGATVPLKIPNWLTAQIQNGTVNACTALDAVESRLTGNLSTRQLNKFATDKYGSRLGYSFSWGTITEASYEPTEEDPSSVSFTISLDAILEGFPSPSLLFGLMETHISGHALRGMPEEVTYGGGWDTMKLVAYGTKQADLRPWMAETFIPRVLPSILEKANMVAFHYEHDGMAEAIDLLECIGVDTPLHYDGNLKEPAKAFFVVSPYEIH